MSIDLIEPRAAAAASAAASAVASDIADAPALPSPPRHAPAAMGGVNEFLTFRLGHEEYGIDILRVQEIRSYEAPTRVANAPDYLLGVINLRGVIVPIVDMRRRFQLDDASFGSSTVTIVLGLPARVVGIVVDSVSDVVTLAAAQMRPVPEFGAAVDSEHLHAMGVVDERMLFLVDIVKLMGGAGMGL